MKKIIAFIFSLFTLLLPFSGMAMAEGNEKYSEKQKQQIESFCKELWRKAKKETLRKPAMFTGDILPYVKRAVSTAADHGLNFRIEYIKFKNGTGYYVLLLYVGRNILVCDYYRIVRELNRMKTEGIPLTQAAEQLAKWFAMDSVKYDESYGGMIKYGVIYRPGPSLHFLASPPLTPPEAVCVFNK